MLFSAETRVRVRYAETDKMGIVYHSNYLIWFEVGRSELLRHYGLAYTAFEEQGLGLAVVEASCKYRLPARYDDELIIKTQLDRFTSRKVTFSYEILREDTLLAEGKTEHVFVNPEGKVANAKNYPLWQEVVKVLDPQPL